MIRMRYLLVLFLCLKFSNVVVAQQQFLNIQTKNKAVSLENIFEQIRQQIGFNFICNNEILANAKPVNINKKASLKEILDELFAGQNLSYTIVDQTILVKANSTNKTKVKKTVTGNVKDDSGISIPGATISVKGLDIATSTNSIGNYSIQVPNEDDILICSFISFKTQEIAIKGKNKIDFTLITSTEILKEVIVTTALGIKREEKSLGYAITKIEGEDISKTAPNNWVNALSGKVPGLNISKAGAGPGGSVRITMRGQNSLDLDKGEPLIVIDGVPITSGMIGNNGQSYGATGNTETPVDYGNALSEINADDIKEVSILRGPSAAALYGSRAGAGAIIITTKSNTDKNERFSVAFNTGLTIDNVLHYPDFQFEYGSGNPGANLYYSFGTSPDGVNTNSARAWGPKFEGQQFYQYNPETQQANTAPTPWVADKNYVKDAFKTGITTNNTLTLTGGDSKNSIRLSYNNLKNQYILPNTGYQFDRLSFSSNSKLHKFTLNTRVNYYHKGSDNLPLSGYNSNTYMYAVMYGNANIPFNWYQNYWRTGQEDIQQNNSLNTAIDNPYFMLYQNLNTQDNDRVFGNITASYELSKKMSLQLRGGIDETQSFRTTRRPFSSVRYFNGRYQEQTVNTKEQNFDFLYKYAEKLSENIGLGISAGGSITKQSSRNILVTAERLSYPGLYTLANTKDRPLIQPERINKEVQSVYLLSQFNYKTFLFLDVTGRNDWSSTLPPKNNSYFYYSLSGSAVFTEMFDLTAIKPLSFLKLRASSAQVGNDTDPYRTSFAFSSSSFGGSFTNPTTLPGGENLKPEIITNRELGLDIRFFNNRVGFDITYYNADSKNQILEVPIDPATGYYNRVFNAGLINNSGWETAITGNILGRNNKLKWKTILTWSKNKSLIKELAPGTESIIMAQGPRGYIEARVGGSIGDIYGAGYLRSPDGQIVNDASGYPIIDNQNFKYIGSAVADWKGGLNNQFSYKNWSFGFLFDGQMGGKVYSFSHSVLAGNGKLISTLPGRYNGLVGEGVKLNSDGSYSPNDIVADAPGYYNAKYLRDNVEGNTFDASYIKLREANIEFKLSPTLLKKAKFIRTASISIYGRDLFMITKFPLYDPEIATLNKNRIEPGFETGQFPSTRSLGASLKASF